MREERRYGGVSRKGLHRPSQEKGWDSAASPKEKRKTKKKQKPRKIEAEHLGKSYKSEFLFGEKNEKSKARKVRGENLSSKSQGFNLKCLSIIKT